MEAPPPQLHAIDFSDGHMTLLLTHNPHNHSVREAYPSVSKRKITRLRQEKSFALVSADRRLYPGLPPEPTEPPLHPGLGFTQEVAALKPYY